MSKASKGEIIMKLIGLVVLVIFAVVAIVAGSISIMRQSKASAEQSPAKQETYHVESVNYEGYDNEGIITLDTKESGDRTIRKSKGGIFLPHVFEVDLDGGRVRYRALGNKDGWKELRFDNSSNAFGEFRDILMRHGENVGLCFDGAAHHCIVFIF